MKMGYKPFGVSFREAKRNEPNETKRVPPACIRTTDRRTDSRRKIWTDGGQTGGWIELDRIGLHWIGLEQICSHRIGSDRTGSDPIPSDLIGSDQIGSKRIGSDRVRSDWIELEKQALVNEKQALRQRKESPLGLAARSAGGTAAWRHAPQTH